MKATAILSLLALTAPILAACAGSAVGAGPARPADGNDCAVIAAVAKEHYRFGPDNVPPPLWLDGRGGDWRPACDWSRYGLSFPETYDPDAPVQRDENGRPRIRWVSCKPPRYDGEGALVEAGIMHGPLAGMGVECRVRSGVAGWTVQQCRNTWIS